jgi:hypothetical protein
MTHRLRRDCNHECELCDLASPETCAEFSLMTEPDHKVRWCRECNELAWHEEAVFSDGNGNGYRTSVWACPRCRRVFG